MFGEITGEKLAGGSFAPPTSPILNRVKVEILPFKKIVFIYFNESTLK